MNYAKKAYVEFVLTITKAPKIYKKDTAFAKELKRVSLLFLEKRFSGEICNIDIHLDQSTPHLHVMSRYTGNNSLQKDLDKNYSKKRYQYSDMQKEFNHFVKEHFDFQKFDKLKIDDITKGGKREYLPLSEYKSLNSEISKKVQKEINTILKKTHVVSKLFGENHIKKSDYHTFLKRYKVVKKHYYFLKTLTDKSDIREQLDNLQKENQKLHQELETVKNQNIRSTQYEQTIKEIFGDKIVNLPQKDFNKAIEEKKQHITTLSKNNNQLQTKLKESKKALNQIQKIALNQKHTINSLKKEISLRNIYIKKIQNIILSSKIPALMNTFKNIGESFESFKIKYLKKFERDIRR